MNRILTMGHKQLVQLLRNVVRNWLSCTRDDNANMNFLERVDIYDRCEENPHSLSRIFMERDSFRIALYVDKIREACMKLNLEPVTLVFFLLSHEVGHFAFYKSGSTDADIEEEYCNQFALALITRYVSTHDLERIKNRLLSKHV